MIWVTESLSGGSKTLSKLNKSSGVFVHFQLHTSLSQNNGQWVQIYKIRENKIIFFICLVIILSKSGVHLYFRVYMQLHRSQAAETTHVVQYCRTGFHYQIYLQNKCLALIPHRMILWDIFEFNKFSCINFLHPFLNLFLSGFYLQTQPMSQLYTLLRDLNALKHQ